jgi:hypothetical protein
MRIFMTALVAAAALVLAGPGAAYAATYFYLDTSGDVRSVEAESATEARLLATDRDPDSDVSLNRDMLDEDEADEVDEVLDIATSNGEDVYQYVAITGDVMTVVAPDANTAIIVAPQRAPTSGVLRVDETEEALPTNMEVPIDPTPPVAP